MGLPPETPDSFRFFLNDSRAYHITFDRAAYNRLMMERHQRSVQQVKLHAWDNKMKTAEYWQNEEGQHFITIYLPSVLSGFAGPASSRQAERRLVCALAHESRHACQPSTEMRWYDPLVGLAPSAVLAALLLWGLVIAGRSAWTNTTDFASGVLYAGLFLGALFTAALVLFGLIILGMWFCYKLSWVERDADAFAQRAVRDSEWRRLFTVEPVPLVDILAQQALPNVMYTPAQSQ